MSHFKLPEQTINFRVYHEGKTLIGLATVELPEMTHMTETISGSGVMGEIESPTLGLLESMEFKMTFTSVFPEVFNTLDWTKSTLFELYSATQVSDSVTSARESLPYRINVVGRAKSFPLGKQEPGKKHDNEVTLETTRLEVLYNNKEVIMADKLNFIYRVNGSDLMATIRSQMGMNI